MASRIGEEYLGSARFHFRLYEKLGRKALAQLRPEDFHWQPDPEVNSVQVTLQHLHGNMLSRWTNFLTEDGEKTWRDRDGEFVQGDPRSPDELMALWDAGWDCLFSAIDSLTEDDLLSDVRIRAQKLSVIEALNRQMTHVAYHVGQLVHVAKERRGDEWKTLSVPRGASADLAAITKGSDRYRGSYDERK